MSLDVLNMLEKKKKLVKKNGLLQFVLWREAYRWPAAHVVTCHNALCFQRRAGESHRGRDEECQEVPSDGAPQEEVTISVCQEQRVTQEPGSGGYRGSGSPGQLVSAMKILFVSHDEFLYILINQQILHCQLMLSSLIICTQVTGLLRFCHHRIIKKEVEGRNIGKHYFIMKSIPIQILKYYNLVLL